MAKAGFKLSTTCGCGFRSQVLYQLRQTLCSLLAVLAYASAFSALMWTTKCTWRLLKTYLVVSEDSACISSKSGFNPCRHGWDIGVTVRTDRQTDGFSALYSRYRIMQECSYILYSEFFEGRNFQKFHESISIHENLPSKYFCCERVKNIIR